MRPLVIAVLIVFCESAAIFSVLPVIDDHCRKLGAVRVGTSVGALMMLTSLPKLVGNPLLGRLSDTYGRRPMLALATSGTLVGSLGWALTTHLAWLAAARGIAGLLGAQAGLTQALVADVTQPHERAARLGWLGAGFGLGAALGPAVGGAVGGAWGSHAVGWFGAGLQVTSLLMIAAWLPETVTVAARLADTNDLEGGSRGEPAPNLVLSLLPVFAALLLQTIGISLMLATFSPIMSDRYQLSPSEKGMAWSVFGLVGILVQGGAIRPLVRRLGELGTCVIGLACIAIGCATVAATVSGQWFWPAVGLIAAGTALSSPTLLGTLSRGVAARAQGQLAGASQAVLGVGRSAGYYSGGVLYATAGATVAYGLAAALAVAAAGPLWARARHAARTSPRASG